MRLWHDFDCQLHPVVPRAQKCAQCTMNSCAVFAHELREHRRAPGTVGFASQSGALCTSILDWSLAQQFGFSALAKLCHFAMKFIENA
jgi:hypothetical protein